MPQYLDKTLDDEAHRRFVRKALTEITKTVSQVNTEVTVIKSVFEQDHPREIARDLARLSLQVNDNKNANKVLTGKLTLLVAGVSTFITGVVTYVTKHLA